jgi:hypothetical protein
LIEKLDTSLSVSSSTYADVVTEPLVFRHGTAATAFDVALGAWAAFELLMGLRQRRRLDGRPARDPSGLVLTACIGGSIIAAVRLGRTDPRPRCASQAMYKVSRAQIDVLFRGHWQEPNGSVSDANITGHASLQPHQLPWGSENFAIFGSTNGG